MKKIMAMAAVAAMLGSGATLQADYDKKSPQEMREKSDKKMEGMRKDLNLSAEQQNKVREAKDEKVKATQKARDDYDKKVRSILNRDQLKKYDDKKK